MKILPETLFRGLVLAFRKPPVTLKDFPKATCDTGNCSESRPRMYTVEIQPMRVKERGNINLMRLSAYRTISRNSKGFQRTKQKLNILFNKPSLKFKKNPSAHVQKVLI
jgi:hypothetical protein